jgi:hypothetical protein
VGASMGVKGSIWEPRVLTAMNDRHVAAVATANERRWGLAASARDPKSWHL